VSGYKCLARLFHV